MYYPTFFCHTTKSRHLVKDRYFCECGQKYNLTFQIKKRDLKNIKFRTAEEITCVKCKLILEKYSNQSDLKFLTP
jgi:hypothetical protein